MSRNCVELCVERVSAGFAPGSEFRPVSLQTPGLAPAPSSLRVPAPLEGPGHASLACPLTGTDVHRTSVFVLLAPVLALGAVVPRPPLGLTTLPAPSGVCNGPPPVALRDSRRNPGRTVNQPHSVADRQVNARLFARNTSLQTGKPDETPGSFNVRNLKTYLPGESS